MIYPELGFPELSAAQQLIFGVGVTTLGWMIVAFVTEPTSKDKLKEFYLKVRPGGIGWRDIENELLEEGKLKEKEYWDVPDAIKAMIASSIGVYGVLFSFAYWLYGDYKLGLLFTVIAIIAFYILSRMWKKLSFK
jgi:uncharacterized membrane protein